MIRRVPRSPSIARLDRRMHEQLHYYVHFQADFIRPASYDEPSGQELAAVLADGLPLYGINVEKVEGLDFAHYLQCVSGSSTIELMVGAELDMEREQLWYVQPCAKRSIFQRSVVPFEDYRDLLLAVDATLQRCDRVTAIRWFPAFETNDYLSLMPEATSPLRAADYEASLHPLIRLQWRLNRLLHVAVSPMTLLGSFCLVMIVAVWMPQIVAPLVSFLFFSVLILAIAAPFIISVLIARTARQVSPVDEKSSPTR